MSSSGSDEKWLQTSIDNESYSFKVTYDARKNWTEAYQNRMLVFRRGSYFTIQFKSKTDKKFTNIGARFRTQFQEQPFEIDLFNGQKFETYLAVSVTPQQKHSYSITVDISTTAPVGWFQLRVVDEGKSVTDSLHTYITFNPFNKDDDVYTPKMAMIEDYLLNPTTVVHCGSELNYSTMTYQLKQFSVECIAVSALYLNRMHISYRTSPVYVSRAITAFVNDNDDQGLLNGRVYDIFGGTHPLDWKDMGDIFKDYLEKNKPVKYGQSFVYAGLVTSLCRNIGIVCRTVTGFSIGHDSNNDGVITRVLLAKDMSYTDTSENLWTSHSWNNAIMKRKDILPEIDIGENLCDRWQHIDGTPQEMSQGTYQCGPYPLHLLREGISKLVPYDGEYIYSSINGICRYVIVSDSGEKLNEYTKNEAGKLILTSSRAKEVIDITHEYKDINLNEARPARDELTLELEVDFFAQIGAPLKYKIKVRNSAKNQKTVMRVSVALRQDHGGNSITEDNAKSYEFDSRDYNCNGEFKFIPDLTAFDLRQCSFFWDLRCLDPSINKLKVIKKSSYVKWMFFGTISKPKGKWTTTSVKINTTVRNDTDLSFDKVCITAHLATDPTVRELVYSEFEPRKKKSFLIEFTKMPSGNCKILVDVIYGLTVYQLGDLESLVEES